MLHFADGETVPNHAPETQAIPLTEDGIYLGSCPAKVKVLTDCPDSEFKNKIA